MVSTPDANEDGVYTWQGRGTRNKKRKKQGERLKLKNR
jgi:hypothetical protein